MEEEAGAAVGVHLDGLDGTMARSVGAFLEARHATRFAVADLAAADVVLVDLDQPHAAAVLDAVGPRQVVVGIGFDGEPRREGCRRYVQKPLSGGVLVSALADAVSLVGTQPAVLRPVRIERPSHARDVFTKGRAWESPTHRPVDAGPPPVVARLDRSVHEAPKPLPPPRERSLRLVEEATPGGTSGTAAEALEHRLEVEPVEARSGGDLHDPDVLATYRYRPAEHLDGLLRQVARRHDGARWELRGPILSLLADPDDGTVLVSGSDLRLRACCAEPVGEGWEVRTHRRPPDTSHLHRLPLDVLRWDLAVWCSQGRLPDEVDPFELVSVRAWPDLTRCVLTPSVMPVVALLASTPRRPADVADLLGISRTHAFVAVAALDALGLVRHGVAEEPAPAPGATGAERSVLRRLLGRLRVA